MLEPFLYPISISIAISWWPFSYHIWVKEKNRDLIPFFILNKILINSNFVDEKQPNDQTENCNTRKRAHTQRTSSIFLIYTWHRSKSKRKKKMRFIMYADHFDIITKRSFDHALFCREHMTSYKAVSFSAGAPSITWNKCPFRFYTVSVI